MRGVAVHGRGGMQPQQPALRTWSGTSTKLYFSEAEQVDGAIHCRPGTGGEEGSGRLGGAERGWGSGSCTPRPCRITRHRTAPGSSARSRWTCCMATGGSWRMARWLRAKTR